MVVQEVPLQPPRSMLLTEQPSGGHSLGAQIAIDLALSHAEGVRALVLIGPAIGGKPLSKPPVGFEGLMAALRAGDIPQAGIVLGAMPAFPVCGHLVPLDCPDSTRREIQSFLARL